MVTQSQNFHFIFFSNIHGTKCYTQLLLIIGLCIELLIITIKKINFDSFDRILILELWL